MTDKQLEDKAIEASLKGLLEINPNHMIILNIGESMCVKDGYLTLSDADLPFKIKHLRLLNPAGNVTTIGSYFLSAINYSLLIFQDCKM